MSTLKVGDIKHESFTGTTQLKLDSAGNVGIGTTSPDAPLTVHSSSDPEIRFGYNSSQDHRLTWDGSKVFLHADPENANSSSALGLSVDGSTKLYILDSGNVGIGTVSPDEKLHVANTSGGASILIETNNSSGGNILFGDDASNTVGRVQYLHSDNSMRLFTASSERMRIDSSGRVYMANSGLSATAEADDLVVGNLTGGHGITIQSQNNEGGFLCFGDTDTTGTGSRAGVIRYQHSDNSMRFATDGNNERMRIDSSGSVRVGEDGTFTADTGADDLLVGNANNGVNRGMTIYNHSGSDGRICFAQPDDPDAGMIKYSHGSDIMQFIVESTERLRIYDTGVVQVISERLTLGTSVTNGGASDGNVCIEYNGAARNAIKTRNIASGNHNHMVMVSASTATGTISGTSSSVSFNNLSDYRKKENAVSISDGITRIKTLKPYRFNFIIEPSKTIDGFFAHEVTPAVPEAVTGEKDAVDSEGKIDPQMLDSSKLVPLLTAALQEAIAKIEVLETKVAALEAG